MNINDLVLTDRTVMSTQESTSRQNRDSPSFSMTSPRPLAPKDASPIKRNTINQRRCRARRQDYIEDLKRRLRTYETQAIQATAEVQAAARNVADENHALKEEVKALRKQNEALQTSWEERFRSLTQKASEDDRVLREEVKVLREQNKLLQRSCSQLYRSATRNQDKVEGRIVADRQQKQRQPGARKSRVFDGKAFEKGIPFTVLPAPPHQDYETHARPPSTKIPGSMTTRFRIPVRHMPGPPPNSLKSHDVACTDDHAQEDDILAPPVEADGTSTLVPSPPFSNFATSDPDDLASTPHPPYSPPSPAISPFQSKSRLCRPASTANSTPCLEAALIIAGMRGVPSHDITVETEILPELGCHGPLSRPKCISPKDCRTHGPGHRQSQRGFEGTDTISQGLSVGDGSEGEMGPSICAVDNGKLFGILAREG
ncbi:uncharacterized protein Z519_00345 [Cladophialophora bantiana CBS 173.52]|uniref:BZIP domain-containing protein n=1 Tax=Cladophialophora bantiana (strain ATCC 10958 / CBS 173.52 / CDC B-1940 / NIH 8579) TaxID=1442370 RepID=A0A0D2IPG0_CLAB1|nr:uncharacterized protein Z519_00345 [Cladophialophora bantiana CBS 173.52]KIW98684.1 hypothetical protein Z519_00345 [Cladophialophora bantiana CBS 173.52]